MRYALPVTADVGGAQRGAALGNVTWPVGVPPAPDTVAVRPIAPSDVVPPREHGGRRHARRGHADPGPARQGRRCRPRSTG